MTLATISCESWQASAVEVSSRICTSCILVTVMAAVAAFIDIWVRKWERTIGGNSVKLNLINKEGTNYEMNWTGNSSWIRERKNNQANNKKKEKKKRKKREF